MVGYFGFLFKEIKYFFFFSVLPWQSGKGLAVDRIGIQETNKTTVPLPRLAAKASVKALLSELKAPH